MQQQSFAVTKSGQAILDYPFIMERGLSAVNAMAKNLAKDAQSQESKIKANNQPTRAGWKRFRSQKVKLASRGNFHGNYPYLPMEATAYEPGPISCGPHSNGYTYTGVRAAYGVVAVDPRVIPLGTKLYVEGYGEAIAADIGSAIQGNRIDLCFNTYREAIQFGRRQVRVYLLGQ